ncbi:MAG: hypothetical protein M3O82_06220 [Verrucomicrobiota bacterium]|nr:hypothetical protein [Verrucomicrobiota bacterium]
MTHASGFFIHSAGINTTDSTLETIGDSSWFSFVLQTSDPLFPTGSYAHSFGLEEVVRLGQIRDETTLRDFLLTQILPALENFELPFLRFAHDAAQSSDVDALIALDRELDTWKLCRELREASIQVGTRRLQTLLKIAPNEMLLSFAARQPAAHHLVVSGIQMCAAPRHAALTAYAYQTLSGFCSAALKLIRIGQEGCQCVLRNCLLNLDAVIETSMNVKRENAGYFNPLLEIASMRHERAAERLFIS